MSDSGHGTRDQNQNIRMTPQSKAAFARLAKEAGSFAEAFEKIVDWVEHMEPAQRKKLWLGKRPALLQQIGDYIQVIAGGDKAFKDPSKASWSVQIYQRLYESAESERGLQKFATYRLSYAWYGFAQSMRNSAVSLPYMV